MRWLSVAREQHDQLEELERHRAAGGRDAVLAPGRPAVNPSVATALAWELDVALEQVQATWGSTPARPRWRPPAVVFRARARFAGHPAEPRGRSAFGRSAGRAAGACRLPPHRVRTRVGRARMTGPLYRIGRACARHHWPVVVAWLLAAVALVAVAQAAGQQNSDDLSLNGTDSKRAQDLLSRDLPDQAYGTNPIVLRSTTGSCPTRRTSRRSTTPSSRCARRTT